MLIQLKQNPYLASGSASIVSVLARSRVWHNGRTTIPREARAVLGISDGDEVEWVLENGEVKVRKVTRNE
ncbi:MAG: AbrB/MazE/SpoVT family DNA-binding domain-containing protein [Vulcanisaeta sp.]